MAICSFCGGKTGILQCWNLKDGQYCKNCNKCFAAVGFSYPETWDMHDFTVAEAKNILENPEKWRPVAEARMRARKNIKEENKKCFICGTSLAGALSAKWMTSDGRALCIRCRDNAITISPQEFLQGKDKYIESHSSQFFKENMGKVEYPHPSLSVNYTKQRFYYEGELFTEIDSVFSFDSVIKFESDTDTYEVTVGKSGHPIARAVVGGLVFGGAGAVVGAMTAKNNKHKETREGLKYIYIYHRDSLKPDTIRKRVCNSIIGGDLGIIKLEDCLKRVFEFRDEQKEQKKINSYNASANGYSELIELKKLLDMGIITQEEFDAKKKMVLGLL